MASTSTNPASSSSTPPRKSKYYDVFLSFRGEDTRRTFVDHLSAALSRSGIYTFKDDEELRRGEEISPALLKAIEESSIALIVFSKNYASSKWCLDELAKILECKKTMGQTIIPVFYDVDPSHVRNQTGSFEAAFRKYEEAFSSGNKQEKVQRWKSALTEAANIAGHDLQDAANGYESRCIQEIIEGIFRELNHSTPIGTDDLVGMESSVEEVKSLLHIEELNDVRFVGLWGMGGIGKTTLARAVFDQISQQFNSRCFLANVRESSSQYKGLEALQEQLLSDTLYASKIKITSVGGGVNMIKNRLCHTRVLVVVDDVDQREQLEALAAKHDWFGFGSRIIITTRDKHLLTACGVTKIHNVKALECGEALQLLSWNAFHQRFPSEGYLELSNQVVCYARGLPLALKVLGSSLHGRSMNQWESTLNKLHKIPDKDILKVLKISFDKLDEMQKEVFLDIACFFKWEDKFYVKRILKSCGFEPEIVMPVLIEKSLITVSENKLCMHDLIQEMSWYIVDQESPREAGERSRLWRQKDICSVLAENTGTKKVEGIVSENFEPKDINCSTEAFTKMTKLRLLILQNVLFPLGTTTAHLSNELKWLDWHAYPSSYLPASFRAENLVELKMCYSRIVQLWKEIKPLPNLEVINLSHSAKLSRTPDFTVVPKLETLILKDCISLEEVHPSLGALKRLKVLNLKGCTILKKFPRCIHSEHLETFILSGCLKLKEFPEISRDLLCLSEVYLDRTAIKKLPSSIERLTKLTLMDLSGCKKLRSLPITICRLSCLKTLKLSGCLKLKEFPEISRDMVCLSELYLGRTAIKELPSSIEHLTSLTVMDLRACRNLGSLPESICRLRCLKTLELSGCSKLEELPEDLGNLKCLEELHANYTGIKRLPSSINLLKDLQVLFFNGCKGTMSTQSSSLFFPRKKKCEDSVCSVLHSLKGLNSLTVLSLEDCNLSDGGIPSDIGSSLPSLYWLDLSKNNFVSLPASISGLSQLEGLSLDGCKRLEELPLLPSCICNLYANDCQSLISVGDQSSTSLEFVYFHNCFKLLENKGSEKVVDTLLIHALKFEPQSVLRSRFAAIGSGIILPGREIPEWFGQEYLGSKACVQLPLDWYKERILGIAVCVVFDSVPAFSPQRHIYIGFVDHNNESYCAADKLYHHARPKLDSEHTWLTFFSNHQIDLPLGKSLKEWCQIEVEVDKYSDELRARKLGVRIVYEKDGLNASACYDPRGDYFDFHRPPGSPPEISLYKAQFRDEGSSSSTFGSSDWCCPSSMNGAAHSSPLGEARIRGDAVPPQHLHEAQGNESSSSDSDDESPRARREQGIESSSSD